MRTGRETRHAFLNQKRGDTVLVGFHVCFRVDDEYVCFRSVCYPEFTTVQNVIVACLEKKKNYVCSNKLKCSFMQL